MAVTKRCEIKKHGTYTEESCPKCKFEMERVEGYLKTLTVPFCIFLAILITIAVVFIW